MQFVCLGYGLQPASYGKKNGMWYASPGNQGWGSKSAGRNASVLDADITANQPNVLKPSAGRVIRIVNNLDHNVQVSAITVFFRFFFLYSIPLHGITMHLIVVVAQRC